MTPDTKELRRLAEAAMPKCPSVDIGFLDGKQYARYRAEDIDFYEAAIAAIPALCDEVERRRASAKVRDEVMQTLDENLVRVVAERDALKAENERLRGRRQSAEFTTACPNCGAETTFKGWKDDEGMQLRQSLKAVEAERDALAAENEQLRKPSGNYRMKLLWEENDKLRAERNTLKAENEQLQGLLATGQELLRVEAERDALAGELSKAREGLTTIEAQLCLNPNHAGWERCIGIARAALAKREGKQ